VSRLMVTGRRATIVSKAKSLRTIVPLTDDREKLLAGLETIRGDPAEWDAYADTERARAEEILLAFGSRGGRDSDCLPLVARAYAIEEWQEAKRSTERVGYTVGALADLPAPKALIYFGDSLRQK